MEPTKAQQEALKQLPRKTYTLLSPDSPQKPPSPEKAEYEALMKELGAQAEIANIMGNSSLFARVMELMRDLYRQLELLRDGKRHTHCGLCGEKWYVGYYHPVNDHGDCQICAKDQYGD